MNRTNTSYLRWGASERTRKQWRSQILEMGRRGRWALLWRRNAAWLCGRLRGGDGEKPAAAMIHSCHMQMDKYTRLATHRILELAAIQPPRTQSEFQDKDDPTENTASCFHQLPSGCVMTATFLKEKLKWVGTDRCWACDKGRQNKAECTARKSTRAEWGGQGNGRPPKSRKDFAAVLGGLKQDRATPR